MLNGDHSTKNGIAKPALAVSGAGIAANGQPRQRGGGGFSLANCGQTKHEDVSLIARAVSRRWPVSRNVRRRAVFHMLKALADPNTDNELRVKITATLIRMDECNLSDESDADRRTRLDAGMPTERTDLTFRATFAERHDPVPRPLPETENGDMG